MGKARGEARNQSNSKAHPKARTPVANISKAMYRTVGALRQALKLGMSLGHNR